jgi:hypothetical protein
VKVRVVLLIVLCLTVLAVVTLHHVHARKRQVAGCGIIHFGPDVVDQTPPEQNRCTDGRAQ